MLHASAMSRRLPVCLRALISTVLSLAVVSCDSSNDPANSETADEDADDEDADDAPDASAGDDDVASDDDAADPSADGGSEPSADPGALVSVEMDSRVGVLLDEIPGSERDRVAALVSDSGDGFWEQRAAAQVALSGYRLVFRDFFYDESEGKGQLPLPPPELWQFEITSEPEREMVQGHDVVSVSYRFTSTILTTASSPGDAEPELAEVGGVWDEDFVFPIDPELLLQRTGYACMDEEEFPANSVDGENVYTFYDHECEAAVGEDETENSDCHITEHPDEDCIDALERGVGSVETAFRFERLAWDDALADEVRVGEVTNPSGADLAVIGEGLENHRIIYRYIPEDSCAMAEGCVGGSGWRRLLQFDASVKNLGAEALDIGDVDYYLEDTDTLLGSHNIFEYSECHRHYHFSHYGDFVLEAGDEALGAKQAFCLQSTNRYSNNEHSPLTHPYGSCAYQGMQAGWGDDYGAGIECQWIDITDVAESSSDLRFISNPDRFLCEGTAVLDEDGNLAFEETSFTTPDGDPVDRPACDFMDGWDDNNDDARPVEVPAEGGLITGACTRGQIGPLRDCGFEVGASGDDGFDCDPGSTLSLSCSVPEDAPPVVLRLCEYSRVLGQGVACVSSDALFNDVLTAGDTSFEIDCPGLRDADERGGRVSAYTAPLVPEDPAPAVVCTVTP